MLVQTLDRWMVGLLVRTGWKKDNHKVLERIQAFEATEDDSAWQLLYAASRLSAPKMKAQLFLQALEETHHAEIFRSLYRQSSGHALQKTSVERRPLLRPREPWKLFAYFAVGEKSAARRFRLIAEQLDDGPFRRSLVKILEEEEGHIEIAGELVRMTGQTPEAIATELKSVRVRRACETWLRLGRHITSAISRALMTGVFFLMGGLIRTRGSR
jgi:rubrerythrin